MAPAATRCGYTLAILWQHPRLPACPSGRQILPTQALCACLVHAVHLVALGSLGNFVHILTHASTKNRERVWEPPARP
eukprot:scaffold1741_cov409-Prasinococcus_capsulatus_cf.AAC.17